MGQERLRLDKGFPGVTVEGVGNITGYPLKTSDDLKKVSTIAAQGIQCDYCHSVTGAKKMENNNGR